MAIPTELRAAIFRSDNSDYSNGGISAKVKAVTVMGVRGPFEPSEESPPVELRVKHIGGQKYGYAVPRELRSMHTMFGGTFIYTLDSGFATAVWSLTDRKVSGHYAIPLHDRIRADQ